MAPVAAPAAPAALPVPFRWAKATHAVLDVLGDIPGPKRVTWNHFRAGLYGEFHMDDGALVTHTADEVARMWGAPDRWGIAILVWHGPCVCGFSVQADGYIRRLPAHVVEMCFEGCDVNARCV